MAGVLIATALGASAATAAAVGGGVALATAAGGAAKSFSEANKAKKKQQAAEREAKKAMAEARKRIDVNVMEQLAIQKEPYELAREASLVAGTQALQAGVEGEERGAAATAGRVFMGQQDAQAQIRSAMGQDLTAINRAVVGEEARLKDIGMGLSLEEVAGAQLAARDAAEDRAAYITQGLTAVQQGALLGQEMAPLYGADQLKNKQTNVNQQGVDMNTFTGQVPGVRSAGAQPVSTGSNFIAPGQAGQPRIGDNVITAHSQFVPPNINQLAGLGYIPFP